MFVSNTVDFEHSRIGHADSLERGDLLPLSFSSQPGDGERTGQSVSIEIQSDDNSSHSQKTDIANHFGTRFIIELVAAEKNMPQHRNTRRKSFDIGRNLARKSDVSHCGAKYKASVAAEHATKPQQNRNTPQHEQTNSGVNAAVNSAVNVHCC